MSHPDEKKQVGKQIKGDRTRRRGGASDRLLVARRVGEPALTLRVRVEAKKEEKKKKKRKFCLEDKACMWGSAASVPALLATGRERG